MASTYTARTVDVPRPANEKPYNTALRRPDSLCLEQEEDEGNPEVFPVDFDNTAALIWGPADRAGFRVWAVDEDMPDAIVSRRYISVEDGPPQLIRNAGRDCGDAAIFAAACAVERRGGTFNFGFHDEDEIDREAIYRSFAHTLRTWDVPEQRLVWEARP